MRVIKPTTFHCVKQSLANQLIFFFLIFVEIKIAGSSTEFVNKILDKVKSGVPQGGLQEEI